MGMIFRNGVAFGGQGGTDPISADSNQVIIGDGADWAHGGPLKIIETEGDFFVKDNYNSNLRNIYITSLQDSPESYYNRDTGETYLFEAYSFGSLPKLTSKKDSDGHYKEVYSQDTFLKLNSTSKMLLSGKTDILIGAQECLPYSSNAMETKIKIFDGADITITGTRLTSTRVITDAKQIARPKLRAHGEINIDIDDGNRIWRNCTHYSYFNGDNSSRYAWGDESDIDIIGPVFLIHDSPTFHISGSPYLNITDTPAFLLGGEGSLIVRDQAICQVENGSCFYMGHDKHESGSPILELYGASRIRAQALDNEKYGPLLSIESSMLSFYGQGNQEKSKAIHNKKDRPEDYREWAQKSKATADFLQYIKNLTFPLDEEEDSEEIQEIKRLCSYCFGHNTVTDLYPNYSAKNFYRIADGDIASFLSNYLEISYNPTYEIEKNSLSKYINIYYPTDIKIWDAYSYSYQDERYNIINTNGSIESRIGENVGFGIRKVTNPNHNRVLLHYCTDMSKVYIEIKYSKKSYSDLGNYQSNFVNYYNHKVSCSYLPDKVTDNYPIVTDPSSYPIGENYDDILSEHNANKPASIYDLLFITSNGKVYYRKGNWSQFLNSTTSNYDSFLSKHANELSIDAIPQLRFYGSTGFDIGGFGSTYLRMGSRDGGVIETYMLDNCKFELRDDAVLDVRGATQNNEVYFSKPDNGALVAAYGKSTFILAGIGDGRSKNLPSNYYEKNNGFPFLGLFDNAELRLADGCFITAKRESGQATFTFGDNMAGASVSFTMEDLYHLKALLSN